MIPLLFPEGCRRFAGGARYRLAGGCLLGCLLAGVPSGCSTAPPAAAASATEPAKATVAQFLGAIKRGDDDAARGMLTRVARAKCEELGLSMAPPVSPAATYAIGESEVVGESGDVVHVATTWTETDENGFTTSDNVVWVVRLDPEGWRVVGLAMRVFDNAPPLLINFEDPEDMLAKQEQVAMELQRRARATSAGERTAEKPAADSPSRE